MGLRSTLFNIMQSFEVLWTMTPTIDQKLIVLLAGLLLGFLEMSGYANPADHAQNLDILSQFLGAIITTVAIASYFIHNAVIEHAKIKYGSQGTQSPVTPPNPKSSIISRLEEFVLTQPSANPPQLPQQ